VVAEGVSNVIKHAGEVEIAVFADSGALHVVVAGDGVG
jgi:anti-sigma regulatory factor (Ser/Thr protein kinase)